MSGSRTPTTLPQVPPEVPPRAVRSNLPDRERAQPLIDAGRLTLILIQTLPIIIIVRYVSNVGTGQVENLK